MKSCLCSKNVCYPGEENKAYTSDDDAKSHVIFTHKCATMPRGELDFGVGCPGGLCGESSLLTALGEEAGFGPAEVRGHQIHGCGRTVTEEGIECQVTGCESPGEGLLIRVSEQEKGLNSAFDDKASRRSLRGMQV